MEDVKLTHEEAEYLKTFAHGSETVGRLYSELQSKGFIQPYGANDIITEKGAQALVKYSNEWALVRVDTLCGLYRFGTELQCPDSIAKELEELSAVLRAKISDDLKTRLTAFVQSAEASRALYERELSRIRAESALHKAEHPTREVLQAKVTL
jgi:hypothetical protein